jgi:hypothetical protein
MQQLRGVLIALTALAALGLVFYSGSDRRVVVAFFIAFVVLLTWVLQFNRSTELTSLRTNPIRVVQAANRSERSCAGSLRSCA